MTSITITVDDKTAKALRQLAALEDRSEADIVRTALSAYAQVQQRPKGIGKYRSSRSDDSAKAREMIYNPGSKPGGNGRSDRQKILRQIEKALASELDGGTLHNALFAQGGLFHQLAPTKADRQAQRGSELYKRAKARVNELMLTAQRELKQRLVASRMKDIGIP